MISGLKRTHSLDNLRASSEEAFLPEEVTESCIEQVADASRGYQYKVIIEDIKKKNRNHSATTIQKIVRGFLSRRKEQPAKEVG